MSSPTALSRQPAPLSVGAEGWGLYPHSPAGHGECLLGGQQLDSGPAHCPSMGSSDNELFLLACSVRDSSIHFVQTPPGGTRLSRLMSMRPQRSDSHRLYALLLLLLSQYLSCALHWMVTVSWFGQCTRVTNSPELGNEHRRAPVIRYLTRN